MKPRICSVFSEYLNDFARPYESAWIGRDATDIARECGYFKAAAQANICAFTKDLTTTNDIARSTALEPAVLAFAMDLAAGMAFSNALLTLPNPAVGAVIISRAGKLLAASAHRIKGGFHAERRALLLARRLWGAEALRDCVVVCTLEPCSRTGATAPCCDIIAECGAKAVVFGAQDASQAGLRVLESKGIGAYLMPHAACAELARQFFAPHWPVFKMAIRCDGSLHGQISGAFLARYTHEIRSKIDSLAVFGATVRADLPTLDARHSLSRRAPNLLIFSRQSEAQLREQTAFAPLWKVPNRSIQIMPYSSLALEHAGVCMLEGGAHAAALAANDCAWMLLHFDANLSASQAACTAKGPHLKYPYLPALSPIVLGRSGEQFYGFFKVQTNRQN